MYIYNIFFSLKYSDAGLTFLWKRCVCLWGWAPFPALRQWWEMSMPPIYAASIFKVWISNLMFGSSLKVDVSCVLATFNNPTEENFNCRIGKDLDVWHGGCLPWRGSVLKHQSLSATNLWNPTFYIRLLSPRPKAAQTPHLKHQNVFRLKALAIPRRWSSTQVNAYSPFSACTGDIFR